MNENSNTFDSSQLAIVTAADEAYAGCLGQLLKNLERRGLSKRHRVFVFDLGLSAARKASLVNAFPSVSFRTFDFSRRPEHVALRHATYAWKPLVIAEVAEETRGPLLWLDSACYVRTDLSEVYRALEERGFYVLQGQSPLRMRCDPAVSEALGVEPPLLDNPEYVAGVIGLDPRRPKIGELLRQWAEWALDPTLATPQRDRYNPEQALLTVLVLRGLADGSLSQGKGEEVDISSPRPTPWVATRQKVRPWMPLWAWPAVRLRYAVEKSVDQFLHRVKRFKRTRINGLHRVPKEFFQVYVCACSGAEAAAKPVPVEAPRWSYYADPFLWKRGTECWLFVEEFSYLDHAARIVALPLGDGLRAGEPRPLEFFFGPSGSRSEGGLRIATRHLSFPYLFEDAGALYMVPESGALGGVDLFACERFPDRWRWVRRLLDGVDAADTALLRHDGRWWLFTSVREEGVDGRALALFHTDDLVSGRWEAHPMNREKRFAAEPFTTGRCAGTFLRAEDGAWLRPIHSSRHYYGEGARYLRIDVLTREAYQESEYTGVHPLARLAAEVGPHHASAAEGLAAFDVRTRVCYGQHVPLWRRWALKPSSILAVGKRRGVV